MEKERERKILNETEKQEFLKLLMEGFMNEKVFIHNHYQHIECTQKCPAYQDDKKENIEKK